MAQPGGVQFTLSEIAAIAKKLRPVVDRTLPLAEARLGQGLLADRAQFGKVVLVP